MIFDPLTNALYDNSGTFLKTVFCPRSLRPEQLEKIDQGGNNRYCPYCRKEILSLDGLSDSESKLAFDKDPNACVFSTLAARNVLFLSTPTGHAVENTENLPVVTTLRNLPSMEFAAKSGFRLAFRDVGPESSFGDWKFILYQNKRTGHLWWAGDYRQGFPPLEENESPTDYRVVRDWIDVRTDRPFPLGAYAVSADISIGQRVYINDVLEDVPITWWNQGNAHRLTCCVAVWDGNDLTLDIPQNVGCVVG